MPVQLQGVQVVPIIIFQQKDVYVPWKILNHTAQKQDVKKKYSSRASD
jgi:hypothetical protein